MLQGFLIPLVALYMQACYTRARACVRVCTREKTALKDAGWRARLAPFRYAVALIGAPRRCFLQVTGNLERSGMMGIASNSARRSGRKAENPGAWVLTTN